MKREDEMSQAEADEALMRAAQRADAKGVERALAMGAREAGRSAAFASMVQRWGETEGCLDKEACALAIVKAGVRLGREPRSTCSALHSAVMFGAPESVIRALAQAGALINEADAFGRTPLHLALMTGRAGACSALIELGADETARARDGATPLSLLGSARRAEAAIAARRALAEREARAIAAGLRAAPAIKRAGL